MTRYKILDELLASRYHNYSLDDLTEEVSNRLSEMNPDTDGISRRQIEKDIKYMELEGPFLADIERYDAPGYDAERQKSVVKHCLRYAQPGYSIFKKEMSDDEQYLLREALSLLGQFDGLPDLEDLENLRLSLGVRRQERQIVSFTKNPLETSTLFGRLFTAISQRQVVELSYHVFGVPDNINKVAVHPYQLREYNRRWYLICAAENDRKLLNFGLERIDDVRPLPSHKYVEYDGDLDEHFEDVIGVTVIDENPVEKVIFWVSDRSKAYVETKPIHDSQRTLRKERAEVFRQQYPHLQGGRFFLIECRENYELLRELTSFGPELVVLEPNTLSTKISERLKTQLEQYRQNISADGC